MFYSNSSIKDDKRKNKSKDKFSMTKLGYQVVNIFMRNWLKDKLCLNYIS